MSWPVFVTQSSTRAHYHCINLQASMVQLDGHPRTWLGQTEQRACATNERVTNEPCWWSQTLWFKSTVLYTMYLKYNLDTKTNTLKQCFWRELFIHHIQCYLKVSWQSQLTTQSLILQNIKNGGLRIEAWEWRIKDWWSRIETQEELFEVLELQCQEKISFLHTKQ